MALPLGILASLDHGQAPEELLTVFRDEINGSQLEGRVLHYLVRNSSNCGGSLDFDFKLLGRDLFIAKPLYLREQVVLQIAEFVLHRPPPLVSLRSLRSTAWRTVICK